MPFIPSPREWKQGDTPKGDAFDPTDTTPVECNNCDWEGLANQLGCQLPDVPDLFERITPGEPVPAGECPECGCLASVKAITSCARRTARRTAI